MTFRSPISLRDGSPQEFSFGTWTDSDELPHFEDDVTGFNLAAPPGNLVCEPTEIPELPVHVPDHPGVPLSVVSVPIPASAALKTPGFFPHYDKYEAAVSIQPHPSQAQEMISPLPKDISTDISPGPRRSKRTKAKVGSSTGSIKAADFPVPARRRVMDRWYYESGKEPTLPLFPDSGLTEDSSTVPLALHTTHSTPTQSDHPQLTEDHGGGQSEIAQGITSSSDGFPGTQERSDDFPIPGGDNGPAGAASVTRTRIRIGLTLTFPDGERVDQRYSAHPGWTVSSFKERMRDLLRTTFPVELTVGPEWGELDHTGSIGDRTPPGSTAHCPFLAHNSVVRVRQIPRWSGGLISLDRPLQITLVFPDGELRDQQYTLHQNVTVPQFKGDLAMLMGITSPILLEVSPDWEELNHLGPVGARVFPGSSIACSYLTQRSVVRVRRFSSLAPDHESDEPPPSASSHEERAPKRSRDASRVGGLGPMTVDMTGESFQSSSSDGFELDGIIHVTHSEHRKLRTEYRKEAKLARATFKAQLVQEWDLGFPSMGDKENSKSDLSSGGSARYDDDEYAFDCFASGRMEAHDHWAAEKKAMFAASLKPMRSLPSDETSHALGLRRERAEALWEGLRRRYFGEVEKESDLEDGHPPGTRASLQEDNASLRREIAELMARIRTQTRTRVSLGPPTTPHAFHREDPDDPPPGGTAAEPQPLPREGSSSTGIGERQAPEQTDRTEHRTKSSSEGEAIGADRCQSVQDRHYYEPFSKDFFSAWEPIRPFYLRPKVLVNFRGRIKSLLVTFRQRIKSLRQFLLHQCLGRKCQLGSLSLGRERYSCRGELSGKFWLRRKPSLNSGLSSLEMRVKLCVPQKLRGGWLVEIWSGCEWDSGKLLGAIGPGTGFRESFRITENWISGICSTSLTTNTRESIRFALCSTARARVQQRTRKLMPLPHAKNLLGCFTSFS